MTCQFDQTAIVEHARGGGSAPGVDAHVRGCPSCAARLAEQRALTEGLRTLAGSAADARPSPALEPALLAAFAERFAGSAAPRAPWRPWLGAAAVLALVVMGAFYAREDLERARARESRAALAEAAAQFVPWPGAQALPSFESGHLVRVELPASALPVLGIVPVREITGERVLADVLIGQDGLARAVRLAP